MITQNIGIKSAVIYNARSFHLYSKFVGTMYMLLKEKISFLEVTTE